MTDHNTYILNRYIAKSIDLLIAWAFALIIPPVGPLAGLLFLLIADGFHDGQSPGKRLTKLKAVTKEGHEPIAFKESILRNIPFAIVYIFFIVPFIGWFLLVIVGLPILLLESYLICSSDESTRVGDIIADTKVVDNHPHS